MEGAPNSVLATALHPVSRTPSRVYPEAFPVDEKKEELFLEGNGAAVNSLSHHDPAAAGLPDYMHLTMGQTVKAFWRSNVFCTLVATGAMFDAYALSVPQNLLANPGFTIQMSTVSLDGIPQIDPNAITVWGVCFVLGQLFGMGTGGFLSDRFGRKLIMWLIAVFLIVDVVIGTTSKTWQVYCAARLCSGIASGLIQGGITTYLAEVAAVKIRGAVIAMYALLFAFGGLFGTIALNEISVYAPNEYKIAMYSEFIILAMFVPALLFAPESPMYHVRKGNEAKAKRCMRWLYGNVPSYNIDNEYLTMVAAYEDEKADPSNNSDWRQYIECFKGTNLRRTLISVIPLTLQQISGLVLFLGYASYFFALAGYAHPFQASVIIQSVLLFFVFLSFFMLDKIGRRNLLLFGSGMIVLANFALAGLGYMTPLNGGGMIFISCFWAAVYSVSLGPTAWTYLSETSSPALRAKTAGIAAGISALFNLIWSYCIPIMLSPLKANLGLKCGFIYGSLSACGFVLIYFCVPETQGRTFVELDEMFNKHVGTRQFKRFVSEVQKADGRDKEESV